MRRRRVDNCIAKLPTNNGSFHTPMYLEFFANLSSITKLKIVIHSSSKALSARESEEGWISILEIIAGRWEKRVVPR